MKVSDVQKLGLRKRTLDDLDVDIGAVITEDEFNKPSPISDRSSGHSITYRELAIDRLVEMKVPFNSNTNIVAEMFKKYVSVTCPHCGGKMVSSGGGGNGRVMHIDYRCEDKKCNTTVTLSSDHNGFYVNPDEKVGK